MNDDIKEDKGFVPDENVLLPKKPIYKRVWFWIVVVVVIGAIGSAANGGKNDKITEENKPTKQESAEKKDIKKEKFF